MRYFAKVVLLVFFLAPFVTDADCLSKGYTIFFINGVLDTKLQADENKDILQ